MPRVIRQRRCHAEKILPDLAIIYREALFTHLGYFGAESLWVDDGIPGQRDKWSASQVSIEGGLVERGKQDLSETGTISFELHILASEQGILIGAFLEQISNHILFEYAQMG